MFDFGINIICIINGNNFFLLYLFIKLLEIFKYLLLVMMLKFIVFGFGYVIVKKCVFIVFYKRECFFRLYCFFD